MTREAMVAHGLGKLWRGAGWLPPGERAAPPANPVLPYHWLMASRDLCALPTDGGADAELPYPLAGQVKVDGYRALWLGDRVVTREGNPFMATSHCWSALARLQEACGEPMMFDMEYVEDGGFDATAAAFKAGQGDGTCWIFDAVPMRDWISGVGAIPLLGRMRMLETFAPALRSEHVGTLGISLARGPSELRFWLNAIWEGGYEGAVTKTLEGLYARGRMSTWQRWKQRETIDAHVVDMAERDGRLSSILVRFPDERAAGGTRVAKIGSGWSEAEGRELLADHAANACPVVEIAVTRRAVTTKAVHVSFVRRRYDKEVSS